MQKPLLRSAAGQIQKALQVLHLPTVTIAPRSPLCPETFKEQVCSSWTMAQASVHCITGRAPTARLQLPAGPAHTRRVFRDKVERVLEQVGKATIFHWLSPDSL